MAIDKSKEMRAAYEAAFTLHDWEPVRVAGRRKGDWGFGVYHRRAELALWRTEDGRYVQDDVFSAYIFRATWHHIPGGLFWTTVDFVTRKDLWQPEIRKLVAS